MAAVHDQGQPLTSLEFEAGLGDYGEDLSRQVPPSALALKTRLCVAQGNRLVNYYLFAGGHNPPLANPLATATVPDHYLTEYCHPDDLVRRQVVADLERFRGMGSRDIVARALLPRVRWFASRPEPSDPAALGGGHAELEAAGGVEAVGEVGGDAAGGA